MVGTNLVLSQNWAKRLPWIRRRSRKHRPRRGWFEESRKSQISGTTAVALRAASPPRPKRKVFVQSSSFATETKGRSLTFENGSRQLEISSKATALVLGPKM